MLTHMDCSWSEVDWHQILELRVERGFWLFLQCVAERGTTQCRCLVDRILLKIGVKMCKETRNGVRLGKTESGG